MHHLRHTRCVVEFLREFFQQIEKCLAFAWRECRQHARLRPPRRFDEPLEHPLASRREPETSFPPVLGADKCAKLVEAIYSLEQVSDIRELRTFVQRT